MDEPAVTLEPTQTEQVVRPSHLQRLPPEIAPLYEVIGPVGRGGQGPVLLCRSAADGTEVVVKLYDRYLRPGATDPREAWRDLDPEHFVPFIGPGPGFGIEADSGRFWEVLEYCAHGTLADFAAQYGGSRLPARTVRSIVQQLTDAVDHLHHRGPGGIVHRDIKPSNVLVRSLDPLDVVLADLGHTVAMDATTEFHTVAQTPLYSAPEAYGTGHSNHAIDWWGLGMTLAELVAGVHPYSLPGGGYPPSEEWPSVLHEPVPLDRVRDDRTRHLLRGLLTIEAGDRWGAEEVREWLAGGTPAVADDRRSNRPVRRVFRPVAFPDGFETPRRLSAAMIADWAAAEALVKGEDLAELGAWLDERFSQQSIGTILDGRRRKRGPYWSDDRAVMELIVRLDPACRPVFDGEPVREEDLPALAARAAQHDDARRLVLRLYSSHALKAFDGHKTAAGIAKVDHRWHRMAGQAAAWFAAVPEAGPAPEPLEALLLAAAVDLPEVARPSRAESRRRRYVPWYRDLVDGLGAARGMDRPLRDVVARLTRPVADDAVEVVARAVRAAVSQRRQQRRRERLQRARRRATARLPRDQVVIAATLVVLTTGAVPLGIGAAIRTGFVAPPIELFDLDAAASRVLHLRQLFVYVLGDWAAGAATLLPAAALLLLVGGWRFRRGRVVVALVCLVAACGFAVAAPPAWSQGDAALISTLRTTASPSPSCASSEAITRTDGSPRLVQVRVVRSVSGGPCNRAQLLSGWTVLGQDTLPKGVTVSAAALEGGLVLVPATELEDVSAVVVTSDHRLVGVHASDPVRWWSVRIPRADEVMLDAGTRDVLVVRRSGDRRVGEIRSAATGKRLAVLCRHGRLTHPRFNAESGAFQWRCGSIARSRAEPKP